MPKMLSSPCHPRTHNLTRIRAQPESLCRGALEAPIYAGLVETLMYDIDV